MTSFAVPGNQFREPDPGLFRGLDGTGSGNQVPETRGIKKVPGSGDSVPKVPKVTFYFEGALLYFESILCKLKVNFCTLKV